MKKTFTNTTYYSKWKITIINEKKVEFYDQSKWDTHYVEYIMLPSGPLLFPSEYIVFGIPEGAVKKATSLVAKYYKHVYG